MSPAHEQPSGDIPADAPPAPRRTRAGAVIGWSAVALAVIAAAILLYQWRQSVVDGLESESLPQAAIQPAPAEPLGGPAIRFPIEQAAPAPTAGEAPQVPKPPLPALAASDATLRETMVGLLPPGALGRFFVVDQIVRRVVIAVDNSARDQVPQQHSPVQPTPGPLRTGSVDGRTVLTSDNFARYAPFVGLLEAVDMKRLAVAYVRFYPLFQEQYVALGFPNGYFNDRLVQAIDSMLAAPEPAEPLEVVQRKVLFEFADPSLEGLPAGQKTLLRIGGQNAARVKAKLREFRSALVRQSPR